MKQSFILFCVLYSTQDILYSAYNTFLLLKPTLHVQAKKIRKPSLNRATIRDLWVPAIEPRINPISCTECRRIVEIGAGECNKRSISDIFTTHLRALHVSAVQTVE